MTNLAAELLTTAQRDPHAAALLWGEHRLSYGRLAGLTEQFARALSARGVAPGDRVGLVAPNLPGMVVAYYGILRAGAVVVPLNPLLTAHELQRVLSLAEVSAAVAADPVAPVVEQALAGAPGEPFLEPLPEVPEAPEEPEGVSGELVERDPHDPAVLLFTSGTTGTPKGAVLTHDNLISNARMTTRMFAYTADDVFLGALPFFHVFGQTVVLNAPVVAGAAISLVPAFQPRTVLHQLRDHGVTAPVGVPSMFMALNQIQRRERLELPAVRAAISGGAAMPVEVLRGFEELFSTTLYEGYGLSETSPVVAFNHPGRERVPGSIGTACEHARLAVLDDDGREVPRGEVGELAVAGRFVMAGYWRDPQATAAAMVGEWLRTGDLARQDQQDRFWIVDRKKDMILRGGYNVYPRELEEIIYQDPQVSEAAVIGHGELTEDQQVVACLVLAEGADQEAVIARLRAALHREVAAYKRPHRYEVLQALPKNATGKILKREITLPA